MRRPSRICSVGPEGDRNCRGSAIEWRLRILRSLLSFIPYLKRMPGTPAHSEDKPARTFANAGPGTWHIHSHRVHKPRRKGRPSLAQARCGVPGRSQGCGRWWHNLREGEFDSFWPERLAYRPPWEPCAHRRERSAVPCAEGAGTSSAHSRSSSSAWAGTSSRINTWKRSHLMSTALYLT